MTSFISTSKLAVNNTVHGVTIPPQLFAEMFPFHLMFNRHGVIVQRGDALERLCPGLSAGHSLKQHFKINYPFTSLEFEAICKYSGTLSILESLDNGMQFKGQLEYIEEPESIYFLGAPLISDLTTLKLLDFKINDFTLHAPLIDFLLKFNTQTSILLNKSKKLTQEANQQCLNFHEAVRQAKLATAELKAIFETFLDSYFRLNTEGIILGYNAEKTYQLYAPAQNLIGKKLQDVVSDNVARPFSQAIDRVQQTNSLAVIEYSLPLHNIKKNFEAKFIPFQEQQIIVIIRDISERKQAEEANALLATAVKHAADAIAITDAEGKLQYVNPAYEKITGYASEELIGKIPSSLLPNGKPDQDCYRSIWNTISRGQIWNGCLVEKRKNGSLYHQEATISPVCNSAGAITTYVILKRDITERKKTEEELERSLSLLRATLEATADGILVGHDGKIAIVNQKFAEMWGVPEHILETQDQNQVVAYILNLLKDPDEFLSKVKILLSQPETESYDVYELKDGRVFERYSKPQWIAGKIVGRVCSFRDITERKRAEETIRYQALHDILTGLPNRTLFNERLYQLLADADNSNSSLAVMFLDLDRFKTINDTLGHAVGDQLLQSVAKRLKSCLREGDIVARWGGDEFTLLLSHIACKQDAAKIAQRILDTLKPSFELENHSLHISISIGIALYPLGGKDAETLIKNADAALYRAKENGRNTYHFYTSAMNSKASELLALENSLHQAIEREEFLLYYQPQVNTITGEITQMEALVRWQHPHLGLILPQTFIPLAEENGLIVPISEWVLRAACTQNKLWQDAGIAPMGVAVNLSARQFQQPNLVKNVRRVLKETGLNSSCLELEITETTVMQNVVFTSEMLRELDSMGVCLAMNNFGTGYSSLSYLKKFPLRTLKIDPSFVRDLALESKDAAIITAIIALGKGLNLRVVAEGVTTTEQKKFLNSLDCEEMQGDLFSEPLSAKDATQLLIRAGSNRVIVS